MPSFWKSAQTALQPIFRPAQTTIDGIQPGSWASPQNPIQPTRQLDVGVRSWDFTPGINLQFTPRGDTPITFQQLQNVSNSFDLCRLMIETRKDQIVNRPWQIRVKTQPGENKKARLAREAKTPNVAKVTNLLKFPDGHHSFDLWIRMWLEQLLVFDAPTIYPVKNLADDVFQLRIISGATITPLLDQQGFIPQPPNPAYQQIILGIPTTNLTTAAQDIKFTADEIIYRPRNPRVNSRWGFSPVEQIITTLNIASGRQTFMLEYYRSGNVPEALLPMPEGWTPSQIKDMQTWFDSLLSGNLAKRRRLTMIPDAKHPAQFSKSEALTDVTDDYLTRVVAFAFSITPQNLIKQVNRGTAKESSDVAQIEGLEPYLKHIENTLNFVIERTLGIDDVEFAYQDEREIDPLKQAQIDAIYVSGMYTVNEVREARGDDPRPEKEADMLGQFTPTGFVPLDATAAADRADAMTPDPEPGSEPKGGKSTPVKVVKGQNIKLEPSKLTPQSRRARQEVARLAGRFLKDQGKRIAQQAKTAYSARKVKKDDKTETDTQRALAILAALQWDYATLYGQISAHFEASAESGADQGTYQIAATGRSGVMPVSNAARDAARHWALARAAALVGARIDENGQLVTDDSAKWAISDTAKSEVEKTIKQAIAEDWTPAQLGAVIEASTLFTQDHADLIADQETKRAQAMGQYMAWRETRKVAEVGWRVSPGHEQNDICDHYQAKGSVPLGHEFAPGVVAPPDAHPNCECWLEITKWEDDE